MVRGTNCTAIQHGHPVLPLNLLAGSINRASSQWTVHFSCQEIKRLRWNISDDKEIHPLVTKKVQVCCCVGEF